MGYYILLEVLSVDKEIEDNYAIPNIENFVLSVTYVEAIVDKTRQETSSAPQSGFGRQVLNFLLFVMLFGTLSYFSFHHFALLLVQMKMHNFKFCLMLL